ncbi:MAG: 3-methyl-2-oxobutanoate hydroxymethyltransferase, partial [Candidatus Methylomirabilis sp.]|nr:3-methyl-2-oxobutanoate hydroxymethyltransferase [Deltaproteobacteria bacterium]
MTVRDFARKKAAGEKIAVLTAYDFTDAQIVDYAGVDAILVGDSLGMVVQGKESTVPVTLDEMIYHTRCVSRGRERALLIADMPFGSYQVSVEDAKRSVVRMMQEGLAEAVKLEGGVEMADTIRAVVRMGVPVCAHVGLTPQSVHAFGGYHVQGRGDAAAKLAEDAR